MEPPPGPGPHPHIKKKSWRAVALCCLQVGAERTVCSKLAASETPSVGTQYNGMCDCFFCTSVKLCKLVNHGKLMN